MKILLVHQYFLDHNQPGGTRHYELAKYLSALGNEVTIIASNVNHKTNKEYIDFKGKSYGIQNIDDIKVIRVNTYKDYKGSKFKRLLNYLSFMYYSYKVGKKQNKHDVIVGSSPSIFTGLVSYFLSKKLKKRFVFEIRDLWPSFLIELGLIKNKLVIKMLKKLEFFLYNKADLLIPLTEPFKNYLVENGFGHKKISTIPNGIDLEMIENRDFRETSRNMLDKYSELKDKFVCMYIGAHNYANHLEVIIDAAKRIKNEQIAFVLVGDGDYKNPLIKKCEIENIKNVIFIDALPKYKVYDLLYLADICLLTLRPAKSFNTVLPNKLFDYLVMNKHIISNIDGEVKSIIKKTNSGIVIEPNNANELANNVEKMYNNPLPEYDGREFIRKNYSRKALAKVLDNSLKSIVR